MCTSLLNHLGLLKERTWAEIGRVFVGVGDTRFIKTGFEILRIRGFVVPSSESLRNAS